MTLKEMLEKRAKLVADMRAMNDKIQAEKRDFTAEEQASWETINRDIDALTADIEKAEREQQRSTRLAELEQFTRTEADEPGRENEDTRRENRRESRPANAREAFERAEQRIASAMQGWLIAGANRPISEDQRDACRVLGINPHEREIGMSLPDRRAALSAITGAAGGFTVPEGFVANLEVALLDFGGVREAGTVMRTTSGNDLPWPTVNDTGNKGARVAENSAVADDTGMASAFGQIVFKAHKYTSKLILIPQELIEDSAFNLATFVGQQCGIRIGRIQNEEMTTGTGGNMPNGIVPAASDGVTAASATAVTVDELIDLQHSVGTAYRGRAQWMFNDSVLKAVRKLKDGEGRYLWQPSVIAGAPSLLLGKPYVVNSDMAATVESGAVTFLFGDLRKYMIRDVNSIRLRRLVERYAEYDQVGFVAFMRSDGNLLDAGTNPVKKLTQA